MGEVFKARDQRMGRLVAIKAIRQESEENQQQFHRFRREIWMLAQLAHPHIIRALDADQINAVMFLVMEYVQGTDLKRLIAQAGPLGVPDACEYVRQVATGLQYVHEQGLVHRDIKPSNLLLVEKTRTVKILDLGLARLESLPEQSTLSELTRSGMFAGTPEFIAPEQAREARSADIRSDLYSLGCTFYYLLTGRPPFGGRTLSELLYSHWFEHPVPVEQVRAEVPAGVSRLIATLMAKRPEERFQTPAELVAALQTLPVVHPGELPTVELTLARPVLEQEEIPMALPFEKPEDEPGEEENPFADEPI
jgi:serine/threonine-protein kinase